VKLKTLFVAMATFTVFQNAQAVSYGSCTGAFPNPITDICWDCSFPISIGSTLPLPGNGSQEDYDSGVTGDLCTCPNPPFPDRAGVRVSFWENMRQADVVRTPYCMSSLGGVTVDVGINDSLVGSNTPGNVKAAEGGGATRFRQVHWYISPWLFIMQVIFDSNCLESKGFDIAYISEIDPTHDDEDLDRIMNPEDYLVGGIAAGVTCTFDAIQSQFTFGNNALWWCDGANGPTGSLTGTAPDTYSGLQGSTKALHRIVQKLHRLGTQWTASGPEGMCGYAPQVIMDKRQYKFSMTFPVAQSSPDPVFGHCCQPMGRSTILWGAGREFPVGGEDFGYAVFRKRDCCQSIPGTPGNTP
jgi:conjugal transfer pilus assembly protein TraU